MDGTPVYIYTYTYDGNNNLTSESRDVNADGNLDYIETRTYDADGNRISDLYDNDADGNPDQIYTYTYDASGNKTSESRDVNADGNPDYIEKYTYRINTDPNAVEDTVSRDEYNAVDGNVFADNGNGADNDPDGNTFTVTEVNGQAADVGNQVTLASGALLTLNSDGTFNYNPNDQFETLSDVGSDSFTYTIDDGKGGTDTATVNVKIAPVEDEPLLIKINDTSVAKSVEYYGGAFQNTSITATLNNNNRQLQLEGNGWKRLDITGYQVTEITMLRFDFAGNGVSEIQGIGFDND